MQPTLNLPPTLTKHLVGDIFRLTINLADRDTKLRMTSNINRISRNYEFTQDSSEHTIAIKLTKSGFFKYSLQYQNKGEDEWHYYKNTEGKRKIFRIQVDPEWVTSAVVYNVFVRFFKGKVQSGSDAIKPGDGGTFDDVKANLDELKKMGINTLYFNPIHLIGELYRKYNSLDQLVGYLQPGSPYSIKDYKSIDPELTYDRDTKKHLMSDPQQEFKDLIKAAHERGMYIIMDLVFNHTAHDFVFQRIRPEWYLYKQNITSIDDPYLYPEDVAKGLPWGDPRHTVSPFDHGIWWEDAAQLNWEYMIPPAANKPPKNTSLPEMWEYFKSIPRYWIRHFGVDGFRCDIAYRVPSEFWKSCIAEARLEAQEHKNNLAGDVVFIAEAYTNELDTLQKAGFTAVYGDFSNKLGKPIELKGYLDYMYNLSDNHFPPGSNWFIFPESHDFGRTPQKVLGENASANKPAALLANQSRWLLTATLPGIPLIFNGFEKIEWQPVNLFSYGAVDWERDVDLRDFISKVNHIRHEYKTLQQGDYQFLQTSQNLDNNTQIFAFSRNLHSQKIIVVVNMDVHQDLGATTIFLPEEFEGEYILKDLLTEKKYQRNGRELVVTLPPGGAHIFLVEF